MIERIEDAIIDRLKRGLGRMVHAVGSYGGELDEGLAQAIRAFPAAWVTFGGVGSTTPYGTSRQKFKVGGHFVVMVGDRNLRSDAAARRGGPGRSEVGVYALVYAVRRLLMAQDFGLEIEALSPGKVRTLFNSRLEGDAFAVFACEFQTAWIEDALPRDHWPTPSGAADDPDTIFQRHAGQLEAPPPDWLRTHFNYHLAPDDGKADAQDIISTRSTP